MSFLNGNFTQKTINPGQYIYDNNFNSYVVDKEYISSEYFPNWKFTKTNNPNSSIILANGNNAFGTTLPASTGGSNQCLIVQQGYDAQNNTSKLPPILKIRNNISFGPGNYSLSFSARHRWNMPNQPLTVQITNSSSSPLNKTTVSGLSMKWTKNKYDFAIKNAGVYDLILTVTNDELYTDASIFLTDFDIKFVSYLPTTPVSTTTPNSTTTTHSVTTPILTTIPTNNAQQPFLKEFDIGSIIRPVAVAIRQVDKPESFTTSLYAAAFGNNTSVHSNNPISDYYNFRPKLNSEYPRNFRP
jgi:hypothetical protein